MTSIDRNAHTLLLVEDEEDLRELMRQVLELRGYSVVTAGDGQEALTRLDDMGRPCLILTDLLMPGMNGWDFVDRVRERPEFESVPVIVYSSAAHRPPVGATRILRKPAPLERLLSIIGEYCSA